MKVVSRLQDMFNVFSNKQDGPLPSEVIRLAATCAGAEYERFLLAGPPDEKLWMMKPKAQKMLFFINKKILYKLPNMDNVTLGVRIRIATGMLNNLEKDGTIPKDICILYHERLVKRVKEISSAIWTEGLPF